MFEDEKKKMKKEHVTVKPTVRFSLYSRNVKKIRGRGSRLYTVTIVRVQRPSKGWEKFGFLRKHIWLYYTGFIAPPCYNNRSNINTYRDTQSVP